MYLHLFISNLYLKASKDIQRYPKTEMLRVGTRNSEPHDIRSPSGSIVFATRLVERRNKRMSDDF